VIIVITVLPLSRLLNFSEDAGNHGAVVDRPYAARVLQDNETTIIKLCLGGSSKVDGGAHRDLLRRLAASGGAVPLPYRRYSAIASTGRGRSRQPPQQALRSACHDPHRVPADES